MKYVLTIGILTSAMLVSAGCAVTATNQALDANRSQVAIRNYQERAFDTADKLAALRSVINALQDLDFVIDKANKSIGTVTATKFYRNQVIKMSVSVRAKGAQQIIRANMQHGMSAVEDPIAYQNFFEVLQKAMFLEAHEVV